MPKIQGINLWSLTSVARKKIIHRMKLEKILELSLKSNHFHEFLKHHKLPLMELQWWFEEDNWCIKLRCAAQKNEVRPVAFYFHVEDSNQSDDYVDDFFETTDSDDSDEEDSEEENSDEEDSDDSYDWDYEYATTMKCRLDNKNAELAITKRYTNQFYIKNCQRETRLQATEAISKHVGEIAHLKYKLFCSADAPCDILETFVFQTTKSFSRVSLGAGQLSEYISFTEEQIRFFVEHLDVEDLCLECGLQNGGKLENVHFNQKQLNLKRCEWIEPIELFNNTRLEEIRAEFTNSDDLPHIVRIADDWQKGTGFHMLKKVNIEACGWSGKRQLRLQKDGTLGFVRSDDENFHDFSGTIRRFSDGKEAEVKVFTERRRRYRGARYAGVLLVWFFELTVKESDQSSS